jgi:formate hydrogenlyase transcriptional activator
MCMVEPTASGYERKAAEFEHRLLDISSRLTASPLSELQSEIDEFLAYAASFWSFDGVFLYELPADQPDFVLIHSYLKPGLQKVPLRWDSMFIEWSLGKMALGNPVSTLDFLTGNTHENTGRVETYEAQHSRSGIAIPLKVENVVRGCIVALQSAESVTELSDLIGVLGSLGEMLAGALERKRSGNQIRDHLQFEMLLSDISATYVNIAPSEVEKVIREHLGRLARFFGTNRCVLYIFDKESDLFRTDEPLIWWPEEDNGFFEALREWFDDGQPDMPAHFQYYFDKWRKGESQEITSLDALPPEAEKMKMFYERFGVKSALSIPFQVEGSPVAALVITDTRKQRQWPRELIPRLRLCGEIFGNALARKQSEEALNKAFSEIKELKNRFESDYLYLREEMAFEQGFDDVVGTSAAMKQILTKVRLVASTNATILLLGETGTGKGVIARTIHHLSSRSDRPLIQVNCAALSPHLIESELFGHEKGAFTGATARRLGRFELAGGTTLFLDEIGDLPLDLQAKLLRVLQEGEFERVGGTETLKSDARVIAATNKELEEETKTGRFRKDLWYRLSVFPIKIPPLRERIDDIPALVGWLVSKCGRALGKKFESVPVKTLKALQRYSWPGNVRELENVIERAVIASPEGRLKVDVPENVPHAGQETYALQQVERNHILRALDSTGWVIEGPKGAAFRLGLNPATLRARMRKMNIRRPGNQETEKPATISRKVKK